MAKRKSYKESLKSREDDFRYIHLQTDLADVKPAMRLLCNQNVCFPAAQFSSTAQEPRAPVTLTFLALWARNDVFVVIGYQQLAFFEGYVNEDSVHCLVSFSYNLFYRLH